MDRPYGYLFSSKDRLHLMLGNLNAQSCTWDPLTLVKRSRTIEQLVKDHNLIALTDTEAVIRIAPPQPGRVLQVLEKIFPGT